MEVFSMPLFDSYRVAHFSKHPTFEARIDCLSAASTIGVLLFVKEDVTLPANTNATPPVAHFPASQLNEVITTLRYEKPLQFTMTAANLVGTVGTLNEPIGEEEV
jgi:hypothetical protein